MLEWTMELICNLDKVAQKTDRFWKMKTDCQKKLQMHCSKTLQMHGSKFYTYNFPLRSLTAMFSSLI